MVGYMCSAGFIVKIRFFPCVSIIIFMVLAWTADFLVARLHKLKRWTKFETSFTVGIAM